MELITCSATYSSRESLMKGRESGSNFYYCLFAPVMQASRPLRDASVYRRRVSRLNLKTGLDFSF